MRSFMTTIVFVRHGETEWNRSGRWQGHADIPLSAAGREQARQLAIRLIAAGERFDQIYASDLGRALETAQIIGEQLGMPVHPLIELREMHIGGWSGLTSDEIRAQFPDEWVRYEAGGDFPRGGHGETLADFRRRVMGVVEELVGTHPRERLLIATHGGIVRSVLHYVQELTGRPVEERISNTSLTEVIFGDGAPHVVRANDLRHLADGNTIDVTALGQTERESDNLLV